MSASDERRREQEAILDPSTDSNARPNIPPTPIADADRCNGSRYGQHDFSRIHRDDPRGSGLTSVRCWYCSQRSPSSQAKFDEWKAAHP